MTKAVRRVVTGHRADGGSTIVIDGPAPNVRQRQAGDVVVQQGTNHAWINRGGATCRLAMVFVDAEEPEAVRSLRNGGRT